MDISGLVEHVQGVIDMEHLTGELQRRPVVCGDGERGWRALREDEARVVANIVGEAIGKRCPVELFR